MTRHRTDLTKGSILPSTWVNSLMEFVSTMSANIVLDSPSTTTLRANAATDNGQMVIGINGKWRYRSTAVTATHPGGAAGTYDIYVTATVNDFSAADPSDSTDYSFGLVIPAIAAVPVTAQYRKIGAVRWDGAAIVGYELNLVDGTEMQTRAKDGIFIGPSGTYDTNLYRSAADTLKTDDNFRAAGEVGATGATSGGFGTANVALIGPVGPSGVAGLLLGNLNDTNLYRNAADVLKTDDSLIVAANLTVGGNVRLGDADADTVGFFSVAGVARQTAPTQSRVTGITFSNAATTFPPALTNAATMNDLIGHVSRLMNVLQAHGLLGTGGTWGT
jgi:hypothetical protein